ncbi:FRG domain-containing protein [Desulfosporosinus lacus]|uniref:FRG domain-containing protein n=1 Tax=Desulfosporosinus lacus DSM 15449 TaxID=1121420 RepID=A0A1M5QP04_9FIRM|nr:FRG domain-containing protein [Desulfosporosinus lacus]SHH15857.1 FRG domain-containing protein [Desulfosporosinus lacus DSM 15449]
MRRSPYSDIDVVNGCVTYNMKSWEDFSNFINKHFVTYSKQYIWRGQEKSDWLLESSLDRLLKKFNRTDRPLLRVKHLDNFRYSIRGRCEFSSSKLLEDECWALGQHYGLATPLLDWTNSPFFAAFFAVNNVPLIYPNTIDNGFNEKSFAIFALHKYSTLEKNEKMDLSEEMSLKVIDSLFDGNPRLVSQGGLFTKIPVSSDVEAWVEEKFSGFEDYEILIKFIIPYKDIKNTRKILSLLNRMNVNHLSLFPDLQGSSYHCNTMLAVPSY